MGSPRDSEIERDEIGLAARQHGDRRRLGAEMPAIVEFGQRRLDGAVAAIDDQHLGAHAGDRLERGADLVGLFHLVMENVRMLGAKGADPRKLRKIPGRLWI